MCFMCHAPCRFEVRADNSDMRSAGSALRNAGASQHVQCSFWCLTYFFCKMVPLEFWQVLKRPEVVMVCRAPFASNRIAIEHGCSVFSYSFVFKLHPTLCEVFASVATLLLALLAKCWVCSQGRCRPQDRMNFLIMFRAKAMPYMTLAAGQQEVPSGAQYTLPICPYCSSRCRNFCGFCRH